MSLLRLARPLLAGVAVRNTCYTTRVLTTHSDDGCVHIVEAIVGGKVVIGHCADRLPPTPDMRSIELSVWPDAPTTLQTVQQQQDQKHQAQGAQEVQEAQEAQEAQGCRGVRRQRIAVDQVVSEWGLRVAERHALRLAAGASGLRASAAAGLVPAALLWARCVRSLLPRSRLSCF
jgi:hypothetical protein